MLKTQLTCSIHTVLNGAGIWANIGSCNGLLPDGTKPLPEPMLTHHQVNPSNSHFIVFANLATHDYLHQSYEYHETAPITKITGFTVDDIVSLYYLISKSCVKDVRQTNAVCFAV